MKFQISPIKVSAILVLSFFLPACTNKDHISEEKPPDNTPRNQVENLTVNEPSPESDNHSIEANPPLNDCSILIGDVSLSLSENRQDILTKLDTAGFAYSESQPDYPDDATYNIYYNATGFCWTSVPRQTISAPWSSFSLRCYCWLLSLICSASLQRNRSWTSAPIR